MANKLVYPATFELHGSHILVSFPDVPHAVAQGKSIEEAYEQAEEALGAALDQMKSPPEASSIEKLQARFPERNIALIGINMTLFKKKHHAKAVKKYVTIPGWLEEMARSENINFSRTLTDALKEKLDVQ